MKTLMLFRELPDESMLPKFLELDGDFSRFNHIYINEYVEDAQVRQKQVELWELIYGLDGQKQIGWLIAPTKDFDIFIHCGCFL